MVSRWRPPRRPPAAPRPPAGGRVRAGSAAPPAPRRGAPRRCAAQRRAPSRDRRPRAPRDRLRGVLAGALKIADPLRRLFFAGGAPPAPEAPRAGARCQLQRLVDERRSRCGARARRAPVEGRRGSDGDRARAALGWRGLADSVTSSPTARHRSTWRGSRDARRPYPPRCPAWSSAPRSRRCGSAKRRVVPALLGLFGPVGDLAALELPGGLAPVGVGGVQPVAPRGAR